jgi:hypothetical protein
MKLKTRQVLSTLESVVHYKGLGLLLGRWGWILNNCNLCTCLKG